MMFNRPSLRGILSELLDTIKITSRRMVVVQTTSGYRRNGTIYVHPLPRPRGPNPQVTNPMIYHPSTELPLSDKQRNSSLPWVPLPRAALVDPSCRPKPPSADDLRASRPRARRTARAPAQSAVIIQVGRRLTWILRLINSEAGPGGLRRRAGGWSVGRGGGCVGCLVSPLFSSQHSPFFSIQPCGGRRGRLGSLAGVRVEDHTGHRSHARSRRRP